MKKIGALLISFFLLISLVLVLPVQAQNNSKEDRGPLTKITFIHYKKNFAKPVPGGNKPSSGSCYSYIASGAKWRTTEDYVVNPTGSNLDNNFVFNAVNSGASEWENYGGSNIFGAGSLDIASSSAGFNFDNKNVVGFGPYSDNNAIAVTSVWGYFGGRPETREIVEWDMLFNTFYTWGDALALGSSVMDLQNIATHELGHSAGMGDLYSGSCIPETMYGYSGYGETAKRDLNNGDILGIRKLYSR